MLSDIERVRGVNGRPTPRHSRAGRRPSFAKATEGTFLSVSERKVAEGGGFEPPIGI